MSDERDRVWAVGEAAAILILLSALMVIVYQIALRW